MKNILIIIAIFVMVIFIILAPWLIKAFFEDYLAILSYSGSILGGVLTLIGVIITIEYNKKEKKEELELQYFPVLAYNIIEYSEHIGEQKEIVLLFNNSKFNDCDLSYGNKLIEIVNVGRGEIRDLSINIREVSTFHTKTINEINYYILNEDEIKFVPINGKIYFSVGIPKLDDLKEIDNELPIGLTIKIELKFNGIFNKKDYIYIFDFCLWIDKKDNDNYEYSIYNTHIFLK